jgi:hypothetical protein
MSLTFEASGRVSLLLREREWTLSLPDEQKNRSCEQDAHGNVEESCGSFRGQESLEACSESEPDGTTRQSGKHKQQTKAYRLDECRACCRVQVDAHRADTDKPRLRVDPLESGCAPKTEGRFLCCRVTATCCGNLPRQPAQHFQARRQPGTS